MAISTTTLATANASRYLQQLCKHWGHRFEVVFDPHKGSIHFGSGQRVELSATIASLTMTIHDPEETGLDQIEEIVAEHLKRFAFREDLDFAWSRPH